MFLYIVDTKKKCYGIDALTAHQDAMTIDQWVVCF
jgi:hypothetical protein